MAGGTSTGSSGRVETHFFSPPGAFDILSIEAVDEASGWVYFIASPDDPGQCYLYRARLDGIILWSDANLDCEDTRIPSVAVLSLCE